VIVLIKPPAWLLPPRLAEAGTQRPPDPAASATPLPDHCVLLTGSFSWAHRFP